MMTDSKILEVVQAHKEGKKIQFRPIGAISWIDCDHVQWAFQACEYRVAPEPRKPREFYAPEHKLMGAEPHNKEFIETYYKAKAILLREVIE